MGKAINLAGMRFSRLVGVECIGLDNSGKRRWLFSCDCGGRIVANGSDVKSGKVVSCGCKRAEQAKINGAGGRVKIKSNRNHGLSSLPVYHVWKAMRQRCINPNSKDYPDYGARGVSVCERWNDPRNFIADMGERPEGASIDRIDTNGNYEPSNCRWATAHEQRMNQRRMM